MTTSQGARTTGALIPLTVHGPVGAVDVAVPGSAQVMDVAREYAAQAGLAAMPLVLDRLGRPLPPTTALDEAGVEAGDVLVASAGVHRPRGGERTPLLVAGTGDPGRLATWWVSLAVAAAALAGGAAAGTRETSLGRATCLVLAVVALVGVWPTGRLARVRVLAAPGFAAAAAYAWFWQPGAEREPGLVGIAALAAALVAALGRSLTPWAAEGLAVWMGSGLLLFAVAGAGALLGVGATVVWSLLLVAAMLAARLAPGAVVDVPDEYLVDLERLAVSAWSARSRPSGRRGRIVVQERYVADVAARGTRLLTAVAAAVAVVATLAAVRLVGTTTLPLDRVGARVLALCAGAALLLAARAYRNTTARRFLRLGGLGAWAALLPVARDAATERPALAAVLALLLVLAALTCAVALGRGWRSAWWSRRAEVAEALVGAVGLATVLVSTGVFRTVWESVSVHS